MKTRKNVLLALALALFVVSCGDDAQQSSKKSKQTDWEKLNLHGKVKSYTEKKEGRLSTTFYTVFNERGYIVEKGKYTSLTPDKKEITETLEYDENDNLVKTIVQSDRNHYQIYVYGNSGKLLEEQRWAKPIGGSHSKVDEMTASRKYRYQSKGSEENVYVTNFSYGNANAEQLEKTVRYDKQGNTIWEMIYNKGEKQALTEYAYSYDKQGNVVKKVEYRTLNFPIGKSNKAQEKTRDYRGHKIHEYRYNNSGRVVYHKTSTIEQCYNVDNDCKEKNRRVSANETNHEYDALGNSIDNGVSYEYDRQSNWIQKRERYSGHDMLRQYTYFENGAKEETAVSQSSTSEMTISISNNEPCGDGGSIILEVKGGKPFQEGKPFAVESKYLSGENVQVTPREFTKKNDTYSIEIGLGGLSGTSEQQLVVTDSEGNTKTINYTVLFCP